MAVYEFNKSMYEGIRTIIIKGEETGKISNPVYFRAFYNDSEDRFELSKSTNSGFNKDYIKKFSNKYLEYFWAQFTMGEGTYRITMFFKDFDHGTGNIHVLPGMIQFWEKHDNSELEQDGYFVVYNGHTSKIVQNAYESHGGGNIYCEEGWVPCTYSKNKKSKACDFYMQWDYRNISAADLANRIFDAVDDAETIKHKFENAELLKGICEKQSAADMTFLFKDALGITGNVINENGWFQTSGRNTYKNLSWRIYRKNKSDPLSTKKIEILYKTIYLKDYGYFSVYGNGIKQCIDYSEKQESDLYIKRVEEIEKMPDDFKKKKEYKGYLVAGPNYVTESDGMMTWVLVYG